MTRPCPRVEAGPGPGWRAEAAAVQDSGVGDPHKIPEIPCYFVTKLAKALVRAVGMEVSGNYIGPDPADLIRTVGNPSSDGKCTTEDGQTVQIF